MASANGVLSPQSHLNLPGASPPSGKRKRAESSEPREQVNGTVESNAAAQSSEVSQNSQQQIADFVEVLKSHDISPSILNQQLPVRESSAEPHPKRKKGEPEQDASTILTRAASAMYSSLEDVLSDAKSASRAILDQLQIPKRAARTQHTPISPYTLALASNIKAFKSIAENIVEAEQAHQKRSRSVQQEKEGDATTLTNGALSMNSVAKLNADLADHKVVLTLYGSAGGGKQLFSSLQQPVKVAHGASDIVLPLREAGLPYGISTTQIVPLVASGLGEDKKRAPTMGELFANSSLGFPFQPPKPSQIASTRGSTVGWYQPSGFDSIRSRGSQSYHAQNTTCGQWLDYNGLFRPLDAKRRQRERALSLGGAKISSTATSAEQEAAKAEALFQGAYSSFAPVKDDAAAIIPEGLVNRIWWQRLGEKNLERLVSTTGLVEAVLQPNTDAGVNSGALGDEVSKEMEDFEDAVRNWDPQAVDPTLEESEQISTSIQDKQVEEILKEISELLETLNSYQRIRNLSLNPFPRSGGTSTASDPAKPSESELATYNTLKSQLALMIAMLPPYAVAKLNSDQLSELNISTKIQLTIENYKGVMEEDEIATRAKVAEMRAVTTSRAVPPVSVHRNTSSLYGNQYSSPRPAISGGQQYYQPSQTPIRPPSTLQRPPATAPTPYPGQRQPSSTTFRPQANYPTPTYPHQLPRASQTPYGATSSQQYFQTPAASNYSGVSLSARYQTSNQTGFQQNRSQSSTNGLDYRYSNGNPTRQASPQKAQPYSPQSQAAQLQNRSFGTPTPSLSQEHRYLQPPVANSASPLSPQPQASQPHTAGALGATGYHTVMTPEQQSTMMERQRAQLAQHQGTQVHARNAPQAGAISASSAQQLNGGNAVTAGL